MARVQQHGATPQRMPLADRPLKSRDRRAAHGNGTAFSAVAPSSGPYWPPVDPITREWSCPPGPNSWPLNIPAGCPVMSIAQECGAFATYRAVSPQTLSRICTVLKADLRTPANRRSCEPHGFDDRMRERAFPLGEPEHDIVMTAAWHWHEADRAAARHGRCHVGFTLPLELVGLARRVRDDKRHGVLWHVQQRGKRRHIGSTEL